MGADFGNTKESRKPLYGRLRDSCEFVNCFLAFCHISLGLFLPALTVNPHYKRNKRFPLMPSIVVINPIQLHFKQVCMSTGIFKPERMVAGSKYTSFGNMIILKCLTPILTPIITH